MTTELDRVIKDAKRSRKAKNMTYQFTNTYGQQITSTGFNSAWRRLLSVSSESGLKVRPMSRSSRALHR